MMNELAIFSILQFVGLSANGEYEYVGCYTDTHNRALRYGPQASGYTADTCFTACANYRYFALQDGGWCCCDNSFDHATRYGTATNCPATQVGAGWANDLFKNLAVLVSSYPEGSTVFMDQPMTASAAQSYCQTVYGTNLVSIHSEHRNEEVTNLCLNQEGQSYDDQCWLGMSNEVTPTHWFDGTSIDYTNWYGEWEPDHTGTENCVVIKGSGADPEFAGFWYTVGGCTDSLPFICECEGFEFSAAILNPPAMTYGSIPISSDMQFTFDFSLLQSALGLHTIFKLQDGNGLIPIEVTAGCSGGCFSAPDMKLYINQNHIGDIHCALPATGGATVTYGIDVMGKTVTMWRNGVECGSHTFSNDIVDQHTMGTDFDLFSDGYHNQYGSIEHMLVTSKPPCERIIPYPEGNLVFVNQPKTADEAKAYCESQYDANLVSIHSEHQNEEVTHLCVDQGQTQKACWLGMSNTATPTQWFDDTPIDYTSWYQHEPDAPGTQDCVVIKGSGSDAPGSWFSVGYCADTLPFICECKAFELAAAILNTVHTSYGSIPISSDMHFTFDLSIIQSVFTLGTIFKFQNENELITPIKLTAGCTACLIQPPMKLHLHFQTETAVIDCGLPVVGGGKVTYDIDIKDQEVTMTRNGVQCGSHIFSHDIVDQLTMGTNFDLFSGGFNENMHFGYVEHMLVTSKSACGP